MCNRLFMLCVKIVLLAVVVTASVPPHHEEHFPGSEHHKYDAQQIFGEESKAFDQLPLSDKKEKLGVIADIIDNDKDGFITENELKDYIHLMQKKYVTSDVNRHWKHLDAGEGPLNFTYYVYRTYGINLTSGEEINPEYKDMVERDRKRWEGADVDKDSLLTKEEFTVFVHPEDQPHMKHIVIEESFIDMDKDKDGAITVKEYIEDMYVPTEGESEPEWVIGERERFTQWDTDKNGVLDMVELGKWLMPDEYDNAEAEAMHLIKESDDNKDGKLTKEEMVNRIDIFTGSQVTDYGNAFNTQEEHDEL